MRVAHGAPCARRVLVQLQQRGDPDVEPRPPLVRLGLEPRLRVFSSELREGVVVDAKGLLVRRAAKALDR